MSAREYRKKPVTVEAMRWDGTTGGASPILDWVLKGGGTARYECTHLTDGQCPEGAENHRIAIGTLEGTMRADLGDYVIRGVKGEFYPCKPDIFEATYEEVAA